MAEIYSDVLARHDVVVTPEEVTREFRIVWKELDCQVPAGVDRFSHHPEGERGWWQRLLERLCELLGAGPPSKFASSELFNAFAKASAWEVYPEVRGVLEEVRSRGLKIGAIANWDGRLPALLADLDLAESLDCLSLSSALGIAKPNAEIFRHALLQIGVTASAAAHVGDSPREDVEGAAALGMTAVHLERGSSATEAIHDLDEALQVLLKDA